MLHDFDLASWRRRIGYVPQEMLLLHDTVYNNITLGDSSISLEDAREALSLAGAGEFVDRLPDGLHTLLGEHGARVLGGQRQRIALARALVRRPALLILDEVTTSLDPETEADIAEPWRVFGGG